MLRVNPSRLLGRLDELATIGARPDGGVCRLAFSDEDLEGRRLVAKWLTQAGLQTRIDPIGNLFGVLKGQRSSGAVMIGSHTDTVASGGRYDGALGVVAAVESATTIHEAGEIPQRPLIVASFVNEEGVRFMPDMMGSLFLRGDLSLEQVRAIVGTDGINIGHEMDILGFSGSDSLDDLRPERFLELHIEQGPVLEQSEAKVGIVTGVQGLSWTRVRVDGSGNHAGTTPMELRRDAGAAAGRLMQEIRGFADRIDGLRVTIGSIQLTPGLINVIPSRAEFTVDLRHPEPEALGQARDSLYALLDGDDSPCEISRESLAEAPPVTFADSVVGSVQRATQALELDARPMISGAGHDAQILAGCMDAGMIFVPSMGGISHDPSERTPDDDCVAGADVLLNATLELLESK